MAQHDNGRRNAGQQSGAWQEHRDQPDPSSNQQEQSSGRYGSSYGAGQQGAQQGGHGQHSQWEQGRQQQGDNWRERQGPAAGGWRPAMEERDREWNDRGQGAGGRPGRFGGQASDDDYGNRGITESGNFGNYGGGREDAYDTMSGRPGPGGSYGRGGSYDQGGQSAQRFGRQGGYSHGYDARSDSTGGYGSSNFGPDNRYGSGNYGSGDWNAGSYGPGGGGRDRYQGGGRGFDQTYGQSSADDYRGNRAGQGQGGWQDQQPTNRDRYGDNGYQSNWQQGQQGHAFHDPDYHQWRNEQMNKLDRDYHEWRQQRYQRFSDDFDKWRADRDNQRGAGQGDSRAPGTSTSGSTSSTAAGQQNTPGETSGMQSGTSKHDISSTGDKGAGKTATK
ncbi:MAG: hypothetical protein ACJ8IK_12465 [Burkholderiaceae bacterium]|jgi:hypothetical protein